jgi:hypothetical protein
MMIIYINKRRKDPNDIMRRNIFHNDGIQVHAVVALLYFTS